MLHPLPERHTEGFYIDLRASGLLAGPHCQLARIKQIHHSRFAAGSLKRVQGGQREIRHAAGRRIHDPQRRINPNAASPGRQNVERWLFDTSLVGA
jgi:hypothetical protein